MRIACLLLLCSTAAAQLGVPLGFDVALPFGKADPALADMVVTQRSRLSVQPVEKHHFVHVLRLAGAKTRVR